MSKPEQEEVTTAEAADLLSCTPRTIRNLIKRGVLTARLKRIDPTSKGVYKIPKSEIEALLKKQNKNSPRQARVTSSS